MSSPNLIPLDLTAVAASFNFANSTRLTVNGSHIVTAYLKNAALSTGYGTGTGVSANSTSPTTLLSSSVEASSLPSTSTTPNAQQPPPGVPQPAQKTQPALIPSPPPSPPDAAAAQPSTTTTPNSAAVPTKGTPANAVQQGTSAIRQCRDLTYPHQVLPMDLASPFPHRAMDSLLRGRDPQIQGAMLMSSLFQPGPIPSL